MSRRRWLLGVLLSLLVAQSVFAHGGYVRSHPGADAILAQAPERVEIWFSQELFRRQGENWIRVFDPNGAAVHSGEAQIDDDDRSHMWVDLQDGLAAGIYLVTWGNLSSDDGDSEEGTFTFIVDPRVKVTSTPILIATAPAPTLSPNIDVQTQDDESGRGGCFLGLIPMVGLLALTGTAIGKRNQ